MIANSMGGRIAEELFIGQVTTGASNDIEKATEIARAMVCQYGMSDLGPLAYGKKEEQIFLGREFSQHRDFLEDSAIKIDLEVNQESFRSSMPGRKIISSRNTASKWNALPMRFSNTNRSTTRRNMRRVMAGLPLEGDDGGAFDNRRWKARPNPKSQRTKSRFKKPILPPITPNNPATA